MKKIYLLTLLLSLMLQIADAQEKKYYKALIGFYNLENLFDTLDTEGKNDFDFTPAGPYKYNSFIYFNKLDHLADAISQIGLDKSPDGLALFGVAEIENGSVLADLAKTEKLKSRNYQHILIEGPDTRGIDPGLMYNPKYFTVISSASFFVQLPPNGKDAFYTRDVLYVKGRFVGGDTVHIFVNHWPSRLGGEERSMPARIAAAQVCRQRVDSIMAIDANSKILVMGDLNDEPISPSVAATMRAKGYVEEMKTGDMFNPWVSFYKKGIGTLGYQDSWGLFDQIILSPGWLNKEQKGFFYHSAHIFNESFMVQKTGRFKNYPKRTWDGTTYNYGYSDHFPVYITVYKTAK
jgi:hypothetical protein